MPGDPPILPDIQPVTSVHELRELLGPPAEAVANKARAELHAYQRAFIAASPFCLVATASADGSCDVSPKGDPPGFTHVIDDRTIAIPERRGNRRADGFINILSNPHVGLLYFVPGRGDTLRINGRARLVRDGPFFGELVVKGHRPTLALLVDIDEVFFHCAKAFMRSELWNPETWQPDALPRRAVIAQATERPGDSLEELDRYYGVAYRKQLYGEGEKG